MSTSDRDLATQDLNAAEKRMSRRPLTLDVVHHEPAERHCHQGRYEP
jgi:hypothetical protein